MRVSVLLLLCVSLFAATAPQQAVTRVKDLTSVEGVRDNQLIGYGIVVGLAGTGDRRQTLFPTQSLTNLLERMGVSVNPLLIRVNNTAAALVTATLPPFAQPGTRLDITVASIGDASNLQGGLLILTPLRGADSTVYAVAQGPVVTGGFAARKSGSSQTVNHPTVGRVANGALVEKTPPSVPPAAVLRLQLKRADFTTAARITEAVNRKFSGAVARAENSALVTIKAPENWVSRPIEFMAQIETLTVQTEAPTRIVVNERTGTVVLGKEVRIAPVSILHGALTVEIRTTFNVSQPEPLSQGQTKTVPDTKIDAKEERARSIALKDGATVEDLVRALTAIGSTPRDIIAILQNLKAAGAFDADLEII